MFRSQLRLFVYKFWIHCFQFLQDTHSLQATAKSLAVVALFIAAPLAEAATVVQSSFYGPLEIEEKQTQRIEGRWITRCSSRPKKDEFYTFNFLKVRPSGSENDMYMLNFNYGFTSLDQSLSPELKDKLEKINHCVEDFYSENGIPLLLNTSSASPDFTIRVHNQSANTPYDLSLTKSETGLPLSDPQLCSVLAHEIGHHLGLPDTNPSSSCPDRRTGGNGELMFTGSWVPIESLRISPSSRYIFRLNSQN